MLSILLSYCRPYVLPEFLFIFVPPCNQPGNTARNVALSEPHEDCLCGVYVFIVIPLPVRPGLPVFLHSAMYLVVGVVVHPSSVKQAYPTIAEGMVPNAKNAGVWLGFV